MYSNHFQSLIKEAHRVRASKPLISKREWHTRYLSLDLSRQWLDTAAETALVNHAKMTAFDTWRYALSAGNIVNITEQQAATHMHCRSALASTINVHINTRELLSYQQYAQQFLQFAKQFRAGQLVGATGKILTHYVHIGIGGSDLGPRCVLQALDGLPNIDTTQHVSFVSNLDPDDFAKVVRHLNPETTLFGVASKSFNTLETQANAKLAQAWLKNGLNSIGDTNKIKEIKEIKEIKTIETIETIETIKSKIIDDKDISVHFCAMTASPDKAIAFLGFTAEEAELRILPMHTTVGGRYSLWSSIGLPIAIAFGRDVFVQLCEGAAEIDAHFLNKPFTENLPAQLGAIQVWNATALNLRCQPTIAYSQRLGLLPIYLQQLDMESNGKSTGRDGVQLTYPTSPSLLAGVGTPAQHAFFQWFHQGHDDTASVFIATNAKHHEENSLAKTYADDVVRCLYAQADVLWQGGYIQNDKAFGMHGVYPGGRPVSILTLKEITPRAIGALMATFEHAVYTAAVLWGINPFDQWGVELGKQLYAQAKQN
ncbi:MAG: Glucose-6-phosphate isomerase [Pseudomonadota bacterium]|jgi:glucose-6-phosphate isomerase